MSISTNISSHNLLQENAQQVGQKKISIHSSRPPLAKKLTTQQSQRQPEIGLNFQQFERYFLKNGNGGQQTPQTSQEYKRTSSLNGRRSSTRSVQQQRESSIKLINQSDIIESKENDFSFEQQISNAAVLHQRANLGSKARIASAKPFNDRPQSGRMNLANRSNSLKQNEETNKKVQLQIQIQAIQRPSRDIQSAKTSNNSLVRAGLNIVGGFQSNLQQRVQSKQSNRSNALENELRESSTPKYQGLQRNDSQVAIQNQRQHNLQKQSSNAKLSQPFEYKRQNSDVQSKNAQAGNVGQTERMRRLNMIQVNVPLPHITAQSWSIYDVNQMKFIQGKKENYKREVASITKMMCFYTCLQLMEKYNISSETLLTVSRTASRTNGTSACLREGDQLTIDQLFYGLMLPSGNDAAYCLAEYFGQYLQENKYKDQVVTSYQFQWSIVRYFLKEMNMNAFKLRMTSSQFDSPHGLANKHNYSTAADICLLATKCMQIPEFRVVVNTIEMKTEAKFSPTRTKLTKYNWENTNKLLGQYDGIIGCKTGITNPAGPCFCGGYEKDEHKYIIVVLSSKSMESRWVEVPKMIEWAIKKKKAQDQAYQNKYPISKYEEQNKIVRIL